MFTWISLYIDLSCQWHVLTVFTSLLMFKEKVSVHITHSQVGKLQAGGNRQKHKQSTQFQSLQLSPAIVFLPGWSRNMVQFLSLSISCISLSLSLSSDLMLFLPFQRNSLKYSIWIKQILHLAKYIPFQLISFLN